MDPYHREVLALIKKRSGKATAHTFLDSYLGNSHPRYKINLPTLRAIARDWMRAHRDMSPSRFVKMLSGLAAGESSTEKMMVGILLDNATSEQKQLSPRVFLKWLDHLVGWAEVDAVCTGKYSKTEIPGHLSEWKTIIGVLSKSNNINKRRASLVFLCSPLRSCDDPKLAAIALSTITRLKSEREVIITKAISWLLRSMVKQHRVAVADYLDKYGDKLPAIAVRETRMKLKTGRKTVKDRSRN